MDSTPKKENAHNYMRTTKSVKGKINNIKKKYVFVPLNI